MNPTTSLIFAKRSLYIRSPNLNLCTQVYYQCNANKPQQAQVNLTNYLASQIINAREVYKSKNRCLTIEAQFQFRQQL